MPASAYWSRESILGGDPSEAASPVVASQASALLTSAISEISSGDWRLLSCHVNGVHRQRGKRIAHYQIVYRDLRNGREHAAEVVGKLYAADRGQNAYRALKHLWEGGFREPAKYLVPRPYGYIPDPPLLVQGKASGAAVASYLQGDQLELERTAGKAARWLVRLQGGPQCHEFRSSRPPADPARLSDELAMEHPAFATQLLEIRAELGQRLRVDGSAVVPSHGDYHPKNIYVADGTATVIDFDTFEMRPAEYDVGYFIGQSLIMSHLRMRSFVPGARAALAFWREYQGAGGPAAPAGTAVQVARTFLQSLHYELCTLRNGHVHLLPIWQTQCERWLREDAEGALESLIRGR